MEVNKIHNESSLLGLLNLPDGSIDCCVTSPPYFGLRDYGNSEQIGLEDTPELFVEQLVKVFTEVKRVLKKEGTLWLNLGDSYSGYGKGIGDTTISKQTTNKGTREGKFVKVNTGLKPKDLIGIPWMVAFALRSSGWYLRQDIIWSKPNPMPESVTDRCTKAHEYIFLMSKSSRYYYDSEAIKQPMITKEDRPNGVVRNRLFQYDSKLNNNPEAYRSGGVIGGKKHKNLEDNGLTNHSFHKTRNEGKEWESLDGKANKRSVWTVTTKPFKDAHFATFPEELICDMIKAGCPEGGVVLDPFMGAGTTALVARKLNRNYVGFELNPKYIKIAEKRLRDELGLFN